MTVKAEPGTGRMECLAEGDLRGRALPHAAREVLAGGCTHPLLGHPNRLARESRDLRLEEVVLERVSGWRQSVRARVRVRIQDRGGDTFGQVPLVLSDVFTQDVPGCASCDAVSHLFVGGRLATVREPERPWKALKPGSLVRSQATCSAAHDRCLRDGHQRREVRGTVSYTHLRAHETVLDIVCRLLHEKKT